jgi:hypothetical protein
MIFYAAANDYSLKPHIAVMRKTLEVELCESVSPPKSYPFTSLSISNSPQHFPLLTTGPMCKIFHEFHTSFLACLMVNSCQGALAAYTLTLQGRQELEKMERGHSTERADEPVANAVIDLTSFMKGDIDCHSALDHACELVRCSVAFLISEDESQSVSTFPVLTNEPYAADANPGEDWPIADSNREFSVQFAEMAEVERMRLDPHHSTCKIACERIAELALRLA